MFQLPYEAIPKGIIFKIKTRHASYIYIAHQEGEKSGWSENILRGNGWHSVQDTVEVHLHLINTVNLKIC